PHKLEGLPSENVKVKEYQAGLDQLVAEIDKVTVLVEQGQLDLAKTEAINLVKIRNENHKKFR
ncbi:MAG: cytochrome b562, partial [Acinetobacter sp.]|nr:cytochrome b562 [Acinetobacter sp.]